MNELDWKKDPLRHEQVVLRKEKSTLLMNIMGQCVNMKLMCIYGSFLHDEILDEERVSMSVLGLGTYFVHCWFELRERIVVSIEQRGYLVVEPNDVFRRYFGEREFHGQMDSN